MVETITSTAIYNNAEAYKDNFLGLSVDDIRMITNWNSIVVFNDNGSIEITFQRMYGNIGDPYITKDSYVKAIKDIARVCSKKNVSLFGEYDSLKRFE